MLERQPASQPYVATDEFLKATKQQENVCDILAKQANNVRMSEEANIFKVESIKKNMRKQQTPKTRTQA